MAIVRFSREEFEAALPKAKPVGDAPAAPLWQSLGLIQGEFCYVLQPFPTIPVALFIRSSVKADGLAAATAKDSIRVGLCEAQAPYQFIGNKPKAYTTRVKGWEERLITLLRKLANAANYARPCPKCGNRLTPYTSKQDATSGRTFVNCSTCKRPGTENSAVFFWCEDEKGEAYKTLPPELLPPKKDKPQAAAPTSTAKAPTGPACPKCGLTDTVDVSRYTGNGSHYCFPRKGGCGVAFTPGEASKPTGPATAPQASKPPAVKQPAPQPPTLAALVEAVEVMIDTLHTPTDGAEVAVMLRSHPHCAAVARMVQAWHLSQPDRQ